MSTMKLVLIIVAVLATFEAGGLYLLSNGTSGVPEGQREASGAGVSTQKDESVALPEPKTVAFSVVPGAADTPLRTVVLTVRPDDSLEGVAFQDILTAHLLDKGVNVLTMEHLAKIRSSALGNVSVEVRETRQVGGGPAQSISRQETPRFDILDLVKSAGADSMVKVTVIPQSVQENLYENDNTHIREARAGMRVALVTANILDLSGRTIRVGSISFGEPVSIAVAASEVGQVLVQQSKGK